MNNTHKTFKIGSMVAVTWHKSEYVGRYHGYSKTDKKHMVRFPVLTNYGIRLVPLFVKDKDIG